MINHSCWWWKFAKKKKKTWFDVACLPFLSIYFFFMEKKPVLILRYRNLLSRAFLKLAHRPLECDRCHIRFGYRPIRLLARADLQVSLIKIPNFLHFSFLFFSFQLLTLYWYLVLLLNFFFLFTWLNTVAIFILLLLMLLSM